MKKTFTLLILSIFLLSPIAQCSLKKTAIYFAPYDFTLKKEQDGKIENHSTFKKNQKIYFMVHSDVGFKSEYIKYQIVKQDDKAYIGGYTRVRNQTKRTGNRHFYSDYFILRESGKYYLQIFDIENLHQWIAIASFKVLDD